MSELHSRRFDPPRFGDGRQAAIQQIPPPFNFKGVTARVFPVKADMARLTQFVNALVNKNVPPEYSYIRPAYPIVFMQLIHYGRMAVETRNFGWFQQHELVFSVPVERYRMRDGKLEFVDFALLNPFIYVDKESSEIIGREVYGWPKVHGWLRRDIDTWLTSPRAKRRLAEFQTMVYGTTYSGKAQTPRTLVEIDEAPPLTWSAVPPDRDNPMFPYNAVSNTAQGLWQIWADALSFWGNLSVGTATSWFDGVPIHGVHPEENMLQDLGKLDFVKHFLNPTEDQLSYSLITYKQFRDASEPRYACYQGLINSEMTLHQFNQGGLLGDNAIAFGDMSGGYEVRIHDYPSQPIVRSLGIIPSREENIEGHVVQTFKPLLPFWMDVDLGYGRGEVICAQNRWDSWHVPSPNKELLESEVEQEQDNSLDVPDESHLYNTARGEAVEAVTGPFHFPNATIRVLPLMVGYPDKLQDFIDANYNLVPDNHMEVWGDRVFMIITNYDEMWSESDNIGRWAHREVRFAVPVRWYKTVYDDDGNRTRELVSAGTVSPFVYADRDTAMNTMREVYGVPAFTADIKAPADTWMDVSGPCAARNLVELSTDVLPGVFTGERMEVRKLLEVYQGECLPFADQEGWSKIVSNWAGPLIQDLQEKARVTEDHPKQLKRLKAAALAMLTNKLELNDFSLKQFRDAEDIHMACYQALVEVGSCIKHTWDLEEIEAPVHVAIHRYPTQPLVELLGLQVKWLATDQHPIVAHLEAVRPFWMKASVATGWARNIVQRGLEGRWIYEMSKLRPPGADPKAETVATTLAVDGIEAFTRSARPWDDSPELKVPNHVDNATPQRIWEQFLSRQTTGRLLDDAVAMWGEQDTDPLSKQDILDLVAKTKITPQMVIDSILSKEWCHAGDSRFSEHEIDPHVEQKPDSVIRRESLGPFADELFPPEDSMEPQRGGWYPKPGIKPTNSQEN